MGILDAEGFLARLSRLCKSQELRERDGPRFGVDGEDLIDTIGRRSGNVGRGAERGIDQGSEPQEADAAVEECLYRDLVGSVQHRARTASGGEHLACKAQGREARLVRRLEGQRAETGKIEPRGR